MSQRKKRESKKSFTDEFQKQPIILKIIAYIILFLVIVFIFLGGYFIVTANQAPEIAEEDLKGTLSSIILDDQGNEVYEIGARKREIVSNEQVPENLKNAVLSIEDRRFLEHDGVDLPRIFGALLANLRAGEVVQGGSTITQQLVKLSVFSTDSSDRTISRKIQEAKLAKDVEDTYDKDDIFNFYINKVYMGNNVYGMGTAALYYYDKPISELTLSEAALLAGLPNAPSAYEPYENPENAERRRNQVLNAMLETEAISQEEYNEAVNTPISENLVDHSNDPLNPNELILDSFIQIVIDEASQEGFDIYTDGLTIHTTLDFDAQKYLYDLVNNDNYGLFGNNNLQEAISIVDTKNSQIKAVSGGRKQEVTRSLNRATSLNRSIGSVMKPLSAYGPAIEFLDYSTGETVIDEPYEYSSGDSIFNYDRNYKGRMTIREALIDSRNIPALKTLQNVGAEHANNFLNSLDIQLNGDNGVYESNSIGGEVTPLQLSASFAAFGNYGTYTEPKAIVKIVTNDNQEITVEAESRQAMKDSTAYMITDMLKDVISEGTGRRAIIEGLPHAGKTGTTNYTEEEQRKFGFYNGQVPDSWFAGYSPNYSVSVWVGYDNAYNENGGLLPSEQSLPAILYRMIMQNLHQEINVEDWEQPESVIEAPVVKGSQPLRLASNGGINELMTQEKYEAMSNLGEENSSEENSESELQYLPQPSNVNATLSADGQTVTITWSPVADGEVTYTVWINGQAYTTTATSIDIPANAYSGNVEVRLQATQSDLSSEITSIQVTFPETTSQPTQNYESIAPPDQNQNSEDYIIYEYEQAPNTSGENNRAPNNSQNSGNNEFNLEEWIEEYTYE